jgi:hypothetical protein
MGKMVVENTSQTNGTIRSWFSTLKYSWRTALQIDRSQLTAVRAIRSTIGVAVPLILGVATGHMIEGVSIAGGIGIKLRAHPEAAKRR